MRAKHCRGSKTATTSPALAFAVNGCTVPLYSCSNKIGCVLGCAICIAYDNIVIVDLLIWRLTLSGMSLNKNTMWCSWVKYSENSPKMQYVCKKSPYISLCLLYEIAISNKLACCFPKYQHNCNKQFNKQDVNIVLHVRHNIYCLFLPMKIVQTIPQNNFCASMKNTVMFRFCRNQCFWSNHDSVIHS